MITISFDVEKQIVTGKPNEDTNKLVNNSCNYLELCFNFKGEEWENLTKRVLFKSKNSKVYCKQLNNENKVMVPWEVLVGDSFTFSLYGIGDENLRITTTQKKVRLIDSGFDSKVEEALPPTPSIVDDIYNKLNNTIEMEVTYSDGSTDTFDVVVK